MMNPWLILAFICGGITVWSFLSIPYGYLLLALWIGLFFMVPDATRRARGGRNDHQ